MTTQAKHTPGLLLADFTGRTPHGQFAIRDGTRRNVGGVYLDYCDSQWDDGTEAGKWKNRRSVADTKRLVACWNALEGIEDPAALRAQRDELLAACEGLVCDEGELCGNCCGNGAMYADGKAHYMSDGAPTIACPQCGGDGRVPSAEARDAAIAAIARATP